MTGSASIDVTTIVANANMLAHRYDPGHDAFHFIATSRDDHRSAPFLTDEYLGGRSPAILRRSDVGATLPRPAPVNFIFHSAFCCSTLLARLFDLPGRSMGLKEPVVLNDITGWRYQRPDGAKVAQVLDCALTLLSRPFAAGERIVIKPSNVVNGLIPAMLTMRPDARAVLVHAPLKDYLASIARKGMWGRLWVRDLFGKLLRENMIGLGIDPATYISLTDIQVAAVGWLAQQEQFLHLTQRFGDRVVTLNSDVIVARPADVSHALSGYFDVPMTRDEAEKLAAGPIFGRDAKTGADFAAGKRTKDASDGALLHADEVEKVTQWALAVATNAGVPMDLPAALPLI